HELLRPRAHWELLDLEQRVAERIGHQHQQPARAHVDRDRAVAARLDVEVARLAPALALALGSLEHLLRADQVLDEPAHRSAPDSHEPRQLRARDGLRRADEVQRDLPVDLARRPATGDAECRGADSTHSLPPLPGVDVEGGLWSK